VEKVAGRWWIAIPIAGAAVITLALTCGLAAGGSTWLALQPGEEAGAGTSTGPQGEPVAVTEDTLPAPSEMLSIPMAPLVEVSVPREFRGLWVATVANLDFPSRPNLPAPEMRRELDRLVNQADTLGFNALVFQVRPEGDALYKSKLEPWSRFLSGKQGRDPGLDPLQYLIEVAHGQGIEVHAWFNPYRALSSKGAAVADNHISKWASKATRPWGPVLWLDPGVPEVREHAVKVVRDVLDSYAIDGIHLDDYFYPYPEGKRSFPDDPSFRDYRDKGGSLSREAWRRENVDTLVQGLSKLIQQDHPSVEFGISPFGIYRPGQPAGVKGLDQVAQLNADPLKWYDAGWVDYLAPQLYWTTQHERQRYDVLLDWWDKKSVPERPLLVGMDITKVGKDPRWSLEEVRTQVRLSREQDQTAGQIWFRADPILRNHAGLGDLVTELYKEPALPTLLARAKAAPVAPPLLSIDPPGVGGGEMVGVRVELPQPEDARAVVLYRETKGRFVVNRIVGPSTDRFQLTPGVWAVSVVNRVGAESMGARITVPDQDAVSEEE
jgi:uncharacterized lipoprotein YddW (UPF0748 family)